MAWLARLLLLLAGVIAGWFVPRDEIGHAVMQFVVLLIVIFVVSMAVLYLPKVRDYVRRPPPKGGND
ncbi:hypothetical protein GC173_09565 [bacterium]|nr:hypothetical protein [bacterium]